MQFFPILKQGIYTFRRKLLTMSRRSLYAFVFLVVLLLGGVAALAMGGNISIFANSETPTTGVFTGRVTDQSGQGLGGLNVSATMPGAAGYGTTDANGYYTTSQISLGTYQLTTGYPHPTQNCSVSKSATLSSSSQTVNLAIACTGAGESTATATAIIPTSTSTREYRTVTSAPDPTPTPIPANQFVVKGQFMRDSSNTYVQGEDAVLSANMRTKGSSGKDGKFQIIGNIPTGGTSVNPSTMRFTASGNSDYYTYSNNLAFIKTGAQDLNPIQGGQAYDLGIIRLNPIPVVDPNRIYIRGVVKKKSNSQPIMNAMVSLSNINGEKIYESSAFSGSDGSFTLDTVAPYTTNHALSANVRLTISASGMNEFIELMSAETANQYLTNGDKLDIGDIMMDIYGTTPTPSPSPSSSVITQCRVSDPDFPAEIKNVIRKINSFDPNQSASLNPEQIAYSLNLLDTSSDPMLERFISIVSAGTLNTVEVGNFVADYLARQTNLPPEALNLIRNIEQNNFGDYLQSHRKDVIAAISLTRSFDKDLAVTLTEIVNDTTATGYNKNRCASKIALYIDNKYHIGTEAAALLTQIQRIDFGKYVADNPDKATKALELLRKHDPETAKRLEVLFTKSSIKLSDVVKIFSGNHATAVQQVQANLLDIKIVLNSAEWFRYQAVIKQNNGTVPQSEFNAIFGRAIKRALLDAGSPIIQYEGARLVAIMLQNPENFKTVVSFIEHADVNISLVNQLLNDGTFTVNLNAQPVYGFLKVGGQLNLTGTISTGKYITQLKAGYNTCASEGGFMEGQATGRLTANLTVVPRKGGWSAEASLNSTGAWARFNLDL